jgi:BirA family biotin operon repressor/biotin-[acetyl-CoA-carboxylase] ligase
MEPREFANRTVERCESTNDLARALGEAGWPSGTWVSAREQDKGRGRLGRSWISEPGNLFLSVVLRLPKMERWTWVPLAVATAAARAIESRVPGVAVRIKWPNDLWIGRAKLGGIICEGVGNRESSFLIAGLGINCVSSPEGIDQDTASLSAAAGHAITADTTRDAVVEAIRAAAQRLNETGDEAVAETRRFYAERAVFAPGTRVQWGEGESGKVLGLGAAGELEVMLPDGETRKLFAEDVKVFAV